MTYVPDIKVVNETGVRTRKARDYLACLVGIDRPFYTTDLDLYVDVINKIEELETNYSRVVDLIEDHGVDIDELFADPEDFQDEM